MARARRSKSQPPAPRFRPESKEVFSSYAKDVAKLLQIPLQSAQELLARIYFYADTHELAQALKQPGEPGPYENPLPDEEAFTPKALRECLDPELAARDARTIRLAAAAMAEPDNHLVRLYALCGSGLFAPPHEHRASFKEALAAVAHVENDQKKGTSSPYPVAAWRLLRGQLSQLQQFAEDLAVDASSLTKLSADVNHGRIHTINPLEHIADFRSRYARALYVNPMSELGLLTTQAPHPWLAQLVDFYLPARFIEFLWENEDELRKTFPELDAAFALQPDDEDDSWYDQLDVALEAISAGRPGSHPLLNAIPDVETLLKQWPDFTFRHSEPFDFEPDDDPGEMAIYIHSAEIMGFLVKVVVTLIENEESKEFAADDGETNIRMMEYQACFLADLHHKGVTAAIGLCSGVFVDCAGTEEFSASNGLMRDALDSHSAMMNDVWKVMNREFARSEGYPSLSEYLDECKDPTEMGYAVVNLELIPELRGKGWSPALLNLFTQALDQENESIGWSLVQFSSVDESRLNLTVPTPFALVFPIEGDRPESARVVNPLLAMSEGKIPRKAVKKKSDIEKRRQKLTAHFRAMQDVVSAEIVIYDPWEYPMT